MIAIAKVTGKPQKLQPIQTTYDPVTQITEEDLNLKWNGYDYIEIIKLPQFRFMGKLGLFAYMSRADSKTVAKAIELYRRGRGLDYFIYDEFIYYIIEDMLNIFIWLRFFQKAVSIEDLLLNDYLNLHILTTPQLIEHGLRWLEGKGFPVKIFYIREGDSEELKFNMSVQVIGFPRRQYEILSLDDLDEASLLIKFPEQTVRKIVALKGQWDELKEKPYQDTPRSVGIRVDLIKEGHSLIYGALTWDEIMTKRQQLSMFATLSNWKGQDEFSSSKYLDALIKYGEILGYEYNVLLRGETRFADTAQYISNVVHQNKGAGFDARQAGRRSRLLEGMKVAGLSLVMLSRHSGVSQKLLVEMNTNLDKRVALENSVAMALAMGIDPYVILFAETRGKIAATWVPNEKIRAFREVHGKSARGLAQEVIMSINSYIFNKNDTNEDRQAKLGTLIRDQDHIEYIIYKMESQGTLRITPLHRKILELLGTSQEEVYGSNGKEGIAASSGIVDVITEYWMLWPIVTISVASLGIAIPAVKYLRNDEDVDVANVNGQSSSRAPPHKDQTSVSSSPVNQSNIQNPRPFAEISIEDAFNHLRQFTPESKALPLNLLLRLSRIKQPYDVRAYKQRGETSLVDANSSDTVIIGQGDFAIVEVLGLKPGFVYSQDHNTCQSCSFFALKDGKPVIGHAHIFGYNEYVPGQTIAAHQYQFVLDFLSDDRFRLSHIKFIMAIDDRLESFNSGATIDILRKMADDKGFMVGNVFTRHPQNGQIVVDTLVTVQGVIIRVNNFDPDKNLVDIKYYRQAWNNSNWYPVSSQSSLDFGGLEGRSLLNPKSRSSSSINNDPPALSRIGLTLTFIEKSLGEMRNYMTSFVYVGRGAIAIFGSARRESLQAEEMAKLLVDRDYSIVTGGGPGVMESANRGAWNAGGISIGLKILLNKFEKNANAFITTLFSFRYFLSRLWVFSKLMSAAIFMPGGFGSLNEAFTMFVQKESGVLSQQTPLIFTNPHFYGPFKKLLLDMEFRGYTKLPIDQLMVVDESSDNRTIVDRVDHELSRVEKVEMAANDFEDIKTSLHRTQQQLENIGPAISILGTDQPVEFNHPYFIRARELARKYALDGVSIIYDSHQGVGKAVEEGYWQARQILGAEIKAGLIFIGESNGIKNKLTSVDLKLANQFIRKTVIINYSDHGIIFFPGGYSTLDVLMETITLIQTDKLKGNNIMPLVLMDPEFWGPWHEYFKQVLLAEKMVSEMDLHLYTIVSTPEEVQSVLEAHRQARIQNASSGIESFDVLRMVVGSLTILAAIAGMFWVNHWSEYNRRLLSAKPAMHGPYAIARHPEYLGQILVALGVFIIFQNIFTGLILLLIILSRYYQAQKEETYLLTKYGMQYRWYQLQTPMLLPGLKFLTRLWSTHSLKNAKALVRFLKDEYQNMPEVSPILVASPHEYRMERTWQDMRKVFADQYIQYLQIALQGSSQQREAAIKAFYMIVYGEGVEENLNALPVRYVEAALNDLIHLAVDDQDKLSALKHLWVTAGIKLLPAMHQSLSEYQDPSAQLRRALEFSLSGNRFGFEEFIKAYVHQNYPQNNFSRVLTPITMDEKTFERIYQQLQQPGQTVLIVLDNIGEDVADLILIRTLMSQGHTVIVAGKTQEATNDSTAVDFAKLIRRGEVQEFFKQANVNLNPLQVINSGSKLRGIDVRRSSAEFVEAWQNSDVIILKGEGNRSTARGMKLRSKQMQINLLYIKNPQESRGVTKDQGLVEVITNASSVVTARWSLTKESFKEIRVPLLIGFLGLVGRHYTLGFPEDSAIFKVLAWIFFAPIWETIFFQWMAFKMILQRLMHRGAWTSAIIIAVLFALLHFKPEVWGFIVLFNLGILLNLIYERFKSIWLTIFIHSLHNIVVLVITSINFSAQVNMLWGYRLFAAEVALNILLVRAIYNLKRNEPAPMMALNENLTFAPTVVDEPTLANIDPEPLAEVVEQHPTPMMNIQLYDIYTGQRKTIAIDVQVFVATGPNFLGAPLVQFTQLLNSDIRYVIYIPEMINPEVIYNLDTQSLYVNNANLGQYLSGEKVEVPVTRSSSGVLNKEFKIYVGILLGTFAIDSFIRHFIGLPDLYKQIISKVLLAPIHETLLYSWLFYQILFGSLLHKSKSFSLAASTLLFTFVHNLHNFAEAVSKVILGTFFTALYIRFGAIWLPMILHSLYNLIIVLRENHILPRDRSLWLFEAFMLMTVIVTMWLLNSIFGKKRLTKTDDQGPEEAAPSRKAKAHTIELIEGTGRPVLLLQGIDNRGFDSQVIKHQTHGRTFVIIHHWRSTQTIEGLLHLAHIGTKPLNEQDNAYLSRIAKIPHPVTRGTLFLMWLIHFLGEEGIDIAAHSLATRIFFQLYDTKMIRKTLNKIQKELINDPQFSKQEWNSYFSNLPKSLNQIRRVLLSSIPLDRIHAVGRFEYGVTRVMVSILAHSPHVLLLTIHQILAAKISKQSLGTRLLGRNFYRELYRYTSPGVEAREQRKAAAWLFWYPHISKAHMNRMIQQLKKMDVLVVVGEKDTITPQTTNVRFANRIGGQLVTIPNVGHDVIHRKAFLPVLNQWLTASSTIIEPLTVSQTFAVADRRMGNGLSEPALDQEKFSYIPIGHHVGPFSRNKPWVFSVSQQDQGDGAIVATSDFGYLVQKGNTNGFVSSLGFKSCQLFVFKALQNGKPVIGISHIYGNEMADRGEEIAEIQFEDTLSFLRDPKNSLTQIEIMMAIDDRLESFSYGYTIKRIEEKIVARGFKLHPSYIRASRMAMDVNYIVDAIASNHGVILRQWTTNKDGQIVSVKYLAQAWQGTSWQEVLETELLQTLWKKEGEHLNLQPAIPQAKIPARVQHLFSSSASSSILTRLDYVKDNKHSLTLQDTFVSAWLAYHKSKSFELNPGLDFTSIPQKSDIPPEAKHRGVFPLISQRYADTVIIDQGDFGYLISDGVMPGYLYSPDHESCQAISFSGTYQGYPMIGHAHIFATRSSPMQKITWLQYQQTLHQLQTLSENTQDFHVMMMLDNRFTNLPRGYSVSRMEAGFEQMGIRLLPTFIRDSVKTSQVDLDVAVDVIVTLKGVIIREIMSDLWTRHLESMKFYAQAWQGGNWVNLAPETRFLDVWNHVLTTSSGIMDSQEQIDFTQNVQDNNVSAIHIGMQEIIHMEYLNLKRKTRRLLIVNVYPKTTLKKMVHDHRYVPVEAFKPLQSFINIISRSTTVEVLHQVAFASRGMVSLRGVVKHHEGMDRLMQGSFDGYYGSRGSLYQSSVSKKQEFSIRKRDMLAHGPYHYIPILTIMRSIIFKFVSQITPVLTTGMTRDIVSRARASVITFIKIQHFVTVTIRIWRIRPFNSLDYKFLDWMRRNREFGKQTISSSFDNDRARPEMDYTEKTVMLETSGLVTSIQGI